MSLSNINVNTEYLKPTLSVETEKVNSASIFNNVRQESQKLGENASKSSLFYAKLEQLLKNYEGVTLLDIKQIQQKLGFDELNLEKLDDIRINKIIEHIKQTLDKSIVDGKVDLKQFEKILKTNKDRFDALNQGIVGLLIRKGYLNKNDIKDVNSISEIPDETLKKAVETFLADAIKDLTDKSKELTPEQIEKQLESFRTLLDGTDEKDRARIWDAAKAFFAKNDNAKDALTEVLKSYVTPEHLQKFINKVSEEDLQILGINKDELITSLRNVADSENPDAVLNAAAAIVVKIKDFFSKNEETVKNCKNKINEYKTKMGLGEQLELSEEVLKTILTEDELQILRTYNNLTNMLTGTTAGCAENNIKITQDMQDSMNEVPSDFKEDMYKRLEEYIKEHKDEFNISDEEIEKYFNKLTNGEYGNVTGRPTESSSSTTTDNNNLGFSNTNNVTQQTILNSQAAILEKRLELSPEKEKITIEKNNSDKSSENPQLDKSIVYLSAVEIANGIKVGLFTYKEAMEAISDAYYKASSSAKDMLAAYVKQMADGAKSGFLSKLSGSALTDIFQKTGIDPEKYKLKTNYYTKKAIERIEEQKEKEIS